MKIAASIVCAMLLLVLAVLLWAWTPDRSRAALEAEYLATTTDLRLVAGVRLHVRDSGPLHAPVVILLHGFGSSLHTWEPWARALADRYRVVRFDLPGSGLSAPDPTGRYTDARAIEILLALMDQLGIARASLIGNSIGGRIAWTVASRHPDRVAKLVLLAPDGFASPPFDYGKPPPVPAAVGLMRYLLPKPLLRLNLASAYGDPHTLADATVDRYHDLLRAPGVRDALIARMAQTVLEPPGPQLARIAAPVLLLWGEQDAMIPVANAADYTRALADSTLVTFPALGHVPQEEAPEVALIPVRAFLDR